MSDCILSNIGDLWGYLVGELAAQGMLEGLIGTPFTKIGLIAFAQKLGLPSAVSSKILLGLQNGSVDKTTGVRLITLLVRGAFSHFGMKSPFAINFTKKFLGKVPKHLFIAAGLAATAIDLYCAQTCCILAWEKLPYTKIF